MFTASYKKLCSPCFHPILFLKYLRLLFEVMWFWGDTFYYVPTIYTHRIHVWNICIHLPNKNQPKVDKCVSYMDPVISRWETNSKEQYTQTTSKWSYFTPFLWRVFHNPIETHLFWAIYRGYPCPSICNFPRSGPTICMSVSWIWKAKKNILHEFVGFEAPEVSMMVLWRTTPSKPQKQLWFSYLAKG